MSKIDELKRMNSTQSGDDQARLETHLKVLSMQEEERIKSSRESIKLMKELQTAISRAAGEVSVAARQVRDYPIETLNRQEASMNKCLAECERAAARARDNYEASSRIIGNIDSNQWLNLLILALATSLLTGVLVMWVMKHYN